ncbi:MAG: hypothetical protein K2X81_27490, partial [Candidatus Obscuribacterales bacterium]|nr:hypothetical protein [Candidatus Obscuribacterales bacterium]
SHVRSTSKPRATARKDTCKARKSHVRQHVEAMCVARQSHVRQHVKTRAKRVKATCDSASELPAEQVRAQR